MRGRLNAVFDALELTNGVGLDDYLQKLELAELTEFGKETSFARLAAWFGVTLGETENRERRGDQGDG